MANKQKYLLKGDFKLICCETKDDMSQNKSLEISVLEQTISEISEENNIKGKHIVKLRKENELLNEEAVQREEELIKIIKQQEDTIHKAELKICEMEKIIETLMNKKITHTTGTQTETKNRDQGIQSNPINRDSSMQTVAPMMIDEMTTTPGSQHSPNDEIKQSNELHSTINIIREEIKLSVGYIMEQISQTAAKVDALKDSNIDLVSLLTNEQPKNQLLYNEPDTPLPIQQTCSSGECKRTNVKSLAAEMEIIPTQFFRDSKQPKKQFLDQSQGQSNGPQFPYVRMPFQKRGSQKSRSQTEEHNLHSIQSTTANQNNSKRDYLSKRYRKENHITRFNTHIIGPQRTYDRAPTRPFRQRGPHYATRIFLNSKYNDNATLDYKTTLPSEDNFIRNKKTTTSHLSLIHI